jgi:hypothetical protein
VRERKPPPPKDLRDYVRRQVVASCHSLWRMTRDLFGRGHLAAMPADEDLHYWRDPNPLRALDAGEPFEVMVNALPFALRPAGVELVRIERDNTIVPLFPVLAHLGGCQYPTVIAHVEHGPETITEAEARARFPAEMARIDEGRRASAAARAR